MTEKVDYQRMFANTPVYALCGVCYPIWNDRDTEFIRRAAGVPCEGWDHEYLTQGAIWAAVPFGGACQTCRSLGKPIQAPCENCGGQYR